MIGRLPRELEVNGKLLPIRTDFRDVLNLFPMYEDPDLSPREKGYVCCRNMYLARISEEDFDEAVSQINWFIDGGYIPKEEAPVKIIDWEKDERFLMPAISKTISVPDVRSLPYLHWWTFLGAFAEMGEGVFSMILHLRKKLAEGEKLEEWESKLIRKNGDLIRTAEEDAAVAKTNEFIKKLTHED